MSAAASEFRRMVGNPEVTARSGVLEITSGLPVTRELSSNLKDGDAGMISAFQAAAPR